jgi:hypothetical protein
MLLARIFLFPLLFQAVQYTWKASCFWVGNGWRCAFSGSTVVIVVALGSLGGFFADYAFAMERLFCTAINYGKTQNIVKLKKVVIASNQEDWPNAEIDSIRQVCPHYRYIESIAVDSIPQISYHSLTLGIRRGGFLRGLNTRPA